MSSLASIARQRKPDGLAGAVAQIAAIFAVSRLAWLAVAAWTTAHAGLPPALRDAGVAGALCRWDCGWYLGIAEHGYTALEDPEQPGATNFAFFPLFPLLVRSIAPLFGGHLFAAGVALSNALFVVALVYVYRYARLLAFEHATALLTVALLCVLPHSLAFSSAMSESTFLLLLAAAMYYLRSERPLASGIAAALLSATRAPGVLFALAALVHAVRQSGWKILVAPWRAPERFVPVVLAPLGLFLYWAYCFAATGDAFAQSSTARHGWAWALVPVWQNVPELIGDGSASALMVIGAVPVLAGVVLLVRLRLFEDAVYCLAATLLVLSSHGAVSAFRYWIVLFPVWLAFAHLLASRPRIAATVVGTAAALNVFLVVAWTRQLLVAF